MTWKCTNTPKGENKLYSDAKGVVPSLDLRFAEGKNLNDYMTGTPLVDHQRSMSGSNLSAGTFVNSSGLIETAKVNLLPYSEDINSGVWFKSNATINPDASLSPAGTLTADTLNVNNGATFSRLQRSNLGLASGVYTLSYYVKNTVDLGVNTVQVLDSSNTSYTETVLNFSSTTTPNWTRYQVVLDIGATALTDFNQLRITFRPSPSPSTGSSKVDIWGIQLEEGTTASTYIPTTTVPSAAPRFDHDPTTGESLGLLIEESRTNLALRSEEFDNPTWLRNNSTITANTVTAPDGTQTADTIEMLAAGGNDGVYQPISVANGTYTYSFWARADSNKTIKARIYSSTFEVSFNLTSTWQRFSVTESLTVSTAYPLIKGLTVGDQFYIWGAQIEEGSFPTSYIPTTGTALTRSADVASITGSNFTSFYNQNEGTVFSQYRTVASGIKGIAGFNDNTANERLTLYTNATDPKFTVIDGGVTQADIDGGTVTANTLTKTAASYAVNDFSIVHAGGSAVTDVSGTLPTPNRLLVGADQAGNYHCGTIARLTYFPERLPDSSLQTMTTP